MILGSPYNPDKPSKNRGTSSDNSDKDSEIRPKNNSDIDISFVERPPRVFSGVLSGFKTGQFRLFRDFEVR